jgi:hypothetical protein
VVEESSKEVAVYRVSVMLTTYMTWSAFPNLLILSYVEDCNPRAIRFQYRFCCNPQSMFLPSDIFFSMRDGKEIIYPFT